MELRVSNHDPGRCCNLDKVRSSEMPHVGVELGGDGACREPGGKAMRRGRRRRPWNRTLLCSAAHKVHSPTHAPRHSLILSHFASPFPSQLLPAVIQNFCHTTGNSTTFPGGIPCNFGKPSHGNVYNRDKYLVIYHKFPVQKLQTSTMGMW